MSAATPSRVVALSGGIGGAKLALGLGRVMAPSDLTLIANTGDDFEHLGLAISPDIDTLMYTLAGIENPETGWGRRDETWTFMQVLRELGGEDWFNLGDGDLAIHVERTRRLAAGDRLTGITADFCRAFDIACTILPMSDDPVRTFVDTADGRLRGIVARRGFPLDTRQVPLVDRARAERFGEPRGRLRRAGEEDHPCDRRIKPADHPQVNVARLVVLALQVRLGLLQERRRPIGRAHRREPSRLGDGQQVVVFMEYLEHPPSVLLCLMAVRTPLVPGR